MLTVMNFEVLLTYVETITLKKRNPLLLREGYQYKIKHSNDKYDILVVCEGKKHPRFEGPSKQGTW